MKDTWSPTQYERFKAERAKPFRDLIALLEPTDAPRILDVGCGTGELTRLLHDTMQASSTLGIDRSAAMLERSQSFAGSGLRFEREDIASHQPDDGAYDIIVSNAVLQWVPDNPAILAKLTRALAPAGQLAIQVPANHDHPAYLAAERVAQREPFATQLKGYVRRTQIVSPERYAELLYALGYTEQDVVMRVYTHLLPSRIGLVEWVKGSLLTDYERRLSPTDFSAFLEAYIEDVESILEEATPWFYTFKRILLRGRLGS